MFSAEDVRLAHQSGSKPFSQVEEELEIELNRPPTFVEVFRKTHTPRVTRDNPEPTPNPLALEKITEMEQLINNDKDISNFDLVERVFEYQRHETVMGMGSGMRATHFCGDQRSMNNSQRATHTLRAENQQLQEQVVELRKELRENREIIESRQQVMHSRQETMEEKLAESRRHIVFLMAQFQNQQPHPS